MHYTGTIWRPPYEACSALIQVTAGCTHHKCKFCTLYEDVPFKFRMSPLSEVEADLKEMSRYYRNAKRVFFTGANPFVLSFDKLKTLAGLVKKYAMVNVQKYQIVAIGDSVSQCEENYLELLLSSGVKEAEKDTREVLTVTGKITKIAQAVIDGTSHYYLMITDSEDIFDISVVDFIDVVRCEEGQKVTMEYKEGEKANTVLSLTVKESIDIGENEKEELEQTEEER